MAAEWSEYFHTFDIDARKRYAAKMSLIGSVDHYTFRQKDLCRDITHLPSLRYVFNLLWLTKMAVCVSSC